MSINVELTRVVAATLTANGNATAGEHTPVDATSGAVTVTLPAASASNVGAKLSIEKIDTSANAVTVSGSIRGSVSTLTLGAQSETVELLADTAGSWWPVAGTHGQSGTYGRVKATPLRSVARFSDYAAGQPNADQAGNAYSLFGTPVGQPLDQVNPTVISGRLTQAYSGATGSASYAQVNLGEPVTRIGGRFVFDSGATTNSGTAVLIAFAADYSTTYPAVPDASIHCSFGPTAWSFGVFSGGTLTHLLASIPYIGGNLAQDGATVYTAEVVLDRANSTAYILAPDGAVYSVTDSRIGSTLGDWATWECFRNADTDPLTAWTDAWADTVQAAPIANYKALSRAAAAPVAVAWSGTNGWVTVPTASWLNIDTMTINAPPPGPTGKQLIRYTAFVTTTGSAVVNFALSDGSKQYGGQAVAEVTDGICCAEAVATIPAGTALTMQVRQTSGTGSAVVKLNASTSEVAVLSITPI